MKTELLRNLIFAFDRYVHKIFSRTMVAPAWTAAILFLTGITPSITAAEEPQTPEQQRQTLIRVLQSRVPGSTPSDWASGVNSAAAVIQAIPLTADNATNSADILAIGKKTWERKFKDGKTFANCFPNAGKRVAAAYPQFDPKSKQVVTAEIALNQCLTLHKEPLLGLTDNDTMGSLSAYFKSLSDGQKLAIRVTGTQAREKFDAGRMLFQRRLGQQGFACASCHVQQAGSILGKQGLSAVVGQAVTWPRLQPGGRVLGIQMQFQRCMERSSAEPIAVGDPEMNELEYFHAFMSGGLGIRGLAVQR